MTSEKFKNRFGNAVDNGDAATFDGWQKFLLCYFKNIPTKIFWGDFEQYDYKHICWALKDYDEYKKTYERFL
jgi:hypothetical protein